MWMGSVFEILEYSVNTVSAALEIASASFLVAIASDNFLNMPKENLPSV
jgi:hypothetical protein